MSTINQLVRNPRKKKLGKKSIVFNNSPQKAFIVKSIGIRTPKKPNSAQRKTAKGLIRIVNKFGKRVTIEKIAYIPGESHSIKPNAKVYVQNGGPQDLPGVQMSIVRGRGDATGVENRKKGRSLYGVKRPKK